MPKARYVKGDQWYEIEWPSLHSQVQTLYFRTGVIGKPRAESRTHTLFATPTLAMDSADELMHNMVNEGWRLVPVNSADPMRLVGNAVTHEPEDTEEESSEDTSNTVDLHGDGNATNIPEDDEEETSTESFESSSSSSPMPPSIITPGQVFNREHWSRDAVVLRYSNQDLSHSDLWDRLAVEFPKQNERRTIIQRIQATRRDRLETEERLRRVHELENVEREGREVSQAEGVLKRAAERATANGAFERRKRRISLKDE